MGLTEASNIASIEYSKDDRAFFEITLVNGQKFTKYEFREDEAEYKETISLSNHSPIVTHELTFMLDKMGYEASASVESMLNTTLGGLVALVRTTNDEIFLVGYSLPFERSARYGSHRSQPPPVSNCGTKPPKPSRCAASAPTWHFLSWVTSTRCSNPTIRMPYRELPLYCIRITTFAYEKENNR
ncbi:MAG: hypothetical protein ACLR8Y_12350 [Alistipes indistinctus]